MLPPIARITVAYGAGLWTGLVLLVPAGAIWMVTAAGAVLAAMRPRAGVLIGAAAIGMLSGVWRMEAARFECATVWQAGPVSAVLRLHDAPGARGTTSGTVLHGTGGCRGVVRLRLERPVPAGATLLAVGTARGHGVVRLHHVRLLPRPRPWRFRVRAVVERRIRALYGARAGLVDALVLGRRDDVPPGLRQTFADAGLAHLLAISGLHVGILSSWLLLLLRRVGLGERRWLPTVALTWAYVALLGMPAPATRAAGFLSLYAVARARQRHPPLSAIVAVSLLVILAIDPRAAISVGLWLSIAAVLGTSWGTRVAGRLRWSGPVVRLTVSSCGAVLFTAPITAFTFGAVAPVGVLANLVAIPLAGIAVPAVFLSLVGGGLVAGGAGVALAAVERVALMAAALPGATVTGVPGAGFAFPWMLVLAGALYRTGPYGSALSRPRDGRRRVHRLLALAAVGASGSSWMADRARPGSTRAHASCFPFCDGTAHAHSPRCSSRTAMPITSEVSLRCWTEPTSAWFSNPDSRWGRHCTSSTSPPSTHAGSSGASRALVTRSPSTRSCSPCFILEVTGCGTNSSRTKTPS